MLSHRASTGYDMRSRFNWVGKLARSNAGQGTVEYAVILFAFISVVAGLGALWQLFDTGAPVRHALQSASHHVQSVAPGAFSDVFMY